MRYRFQPWQLAVLLVLICVGAIGGAYVYKSSGVYNAGQMASFLPLGTGALVYIDVDALRGSGLLDAIAGDKTAEESEYQSFVDETAFDYKEDLNAVVALFRPDQVFMVLRGRFDWKRLIAYVHHHGGACVNNFCSAPGSRPDRKISFYPIRSNVMAMAVSSDSWAAYQIARKSGKLPVSPPTAPVWAVLTGPALKSFSQLPAGTQSFATALANADQMVFTAGPKGDNLELTVHVTCQNSEKASALAGELETTTDTLRKWLAREKRTPNPSDLSGVLTAGSFRQDNRDVFGAWPIQRSFLENIAGGSNQ